MSKISDFDTVILFGKIRDEIIARIDKQERFMEKLTENIKRTNSATTFYDLCIWTAVIAAPCIMVYLVTRGREDHREETNKN